MRVNIHTLEVQKALENLSISYQLFTPEESEKIYTNFCTKYAQNQAYKYPLWDSFEQNTIFSVQDADAWQWFETLLENQKIWLFFEKKEDRQVFEIEQGEKLSAILGECYLFTFYVSNPDLSFFFSFNDHEVLTAGGTAVRSLQKHWLGIGFEKLQKLLEQPFDTQTWETEKEVFFEKVRKI